MAPFPSLSSEQILALSLADLTATLRAGTVSAVQVLAAYRRRAEEVQAACNPLTCFVEDAERWAREADDHLRRTGTVLGPLHGVPFSIKDHFALKGYPVSMGLAKLREKTEKVPPQLDCAVAVALRRAGAIPFCKTNMSQLGDTWGGGNPAYGDTLNPWDTQRTSGGSSCGEGALIGGGGSPFGIGSDVGGSVRIPAAFCGICALKPTAKRLTFNWQNGRTILSHAGDYGILATAGPMAKRVEDLVEVCAALWTEDLFRFDPYLPPMPLNRQVLAETRPLRIGWCIEEYMYPRPCQAAARAVELVAAALSAAGHTLVPFRADSEGACPLSEVKSCDYALTVLDNSLGAKEVAQNPSDQEGNVGSYGGGPLKGERLHPDLIAAYSGMSSSSSSSSKPLVPQPPKTNTPARYQEALAWRDRLRDQFAQYWNARELDVILCPAWPFPAPRVEQVRNAHSGLGGLAEVSACRLFNFLDYPAGVVTVTRVLEEDLAMPYEPGTDDLLMREAAITSVEGSAGLPVAVQLAARPWREELCLRAMLEVQRRVPFDHTQHARLAPVPRRSPDLGAAPLRVSVPAAPAARL